MKILLAILILIVPPGPVKSLCQDVPLPGPVSSFVEEQIAQQESEPKWTYKKVYDKAVKNESPFLVVVGFEGCEACAYTKRNIKGLMDLGVAVYLDKDHPKAASITWTNVYPQAVAYCPGDRWGRYRAKPQGLTQELAEGMMYRAALAAGHRPEGRYAPVVPTWTEAGSRWYYAGGSATRGHLVGGNHHIDSDLLVGLSQDELDRLHSADHNGRLGAEWKTSSPRTRRVSTLRYRSRRSRRAR